MKPRRQQTPREIIARDQNWRRGQVIALEQRAQQLVHEIAPESDALIRVVAGLTRSLLWYVDASAEHRRKQVSERPLYCPLNYPAMPRS